MALWKGAHKGRRGEKNPLEIKLPADEIDLFSPLESGGGSLLEHKTSHRAGKQAAHMTALVYVKT